MYATALRLILAATLTIAIPALLGGYAAARGLRSAEGAVASIPRGEAADAAVVPRDGHADLGRLTPQWRLHGIDIEYQPRQRRF